MIRLIYLLLEQQIRLKCASWLKHCDLYLRQYEQAQDDDVFATPTVYIRFLPIEWENTSYNRQAANLDFELHLLTDTAYGDSRDLTDTQFINHIANETQLFVALQNHRALLSDLPQFANLKDTKDDAVIMESIVRTRTVPHDQLSNFVVSVLSFRTRIYDYAAIPQMQSIIANIITDVQVVKTITP